MITAIVNSLVAHVYALIDTLIGWANDAPTPLTDSIAGAVALVLLTIALVWATSGDQGSHRVKLPKAPRHAVDNGPTRPIERRAPLANDNVMVIAVMRPPLESVDLGGVHVGAHEDWHPAEEVAAAPERTADDDWLEFLAGARRERALHAGASDFAWSELEWSADAQAALATADAWHEEHGAHCACCHVTTPDGRRLLVERGWRIGENTIEIPVC